MADPAHLMQSMLAAMTKQTGLIDELRKSRLLSELKLDGIKLPSYGGTLKESFQLYQEQVEQYFLAKGIDWRDSKLSGRILAVLAGSLKHGAAQWYIVEKDDVRSVQDFFEKLEEEFVPPDLQERLRDQMNDLKERQCKDLPDYISRFRHLINQVKEMSELDKIMCFLRGLPSNIREEVQYRRCATLAEAITVALDYDRSHSYRGCSDSARDRPRYRSFDNRRSRSNNDGPVPMEIDNVRVPSKEECQRRNLCFKCDSSAHRARQCPMQQQQTSMAKRNAPRYNNSGKGQGRGKPRMNMILEDDDQEDTVAMDRVTMNVVDIQEQADELQRFVEDARKKVETTLTATTETSEETDSCGSQSADVEGLHAMQPEEGSGVCGLPPEQEAGVRVMHPTEDLVLLGSRPTSNETMEVNAVKSERKSNLFIKKGRINGKDVRILLDTGASTNMIKPGMASNVLLSRRLQAQRFDGTFTPATDVKHVEAPVSMDGYFFPAMEFVEWKLPESHDVIFGKPWFQDYNPQVNWQTEEVVIPEKFQVNDVDGPSFSDSLNAGDYEQVFRVKVQLVADTEAIPEPIRKVVAEEFKDVFPEQLPDGLPPMREVNFELTLKKGAQPSSRSPFRLSKMEQDAFEEFIKDELKKGWIEVSNSPWVSYIFAIPKKDPVTGQMPKRADWLRSGNTKIPLRWAFDYRHLNQVTVVAKIPLPMIEELFDKMVGCVVYALIDLARGYHQMIVVKSSRPYTAFRTHKETYQWCVAPMGVAGMPGTWSRLTRTLFDKFEFVVVYLDDICIFSKSMEEHVEHLRAVCEVLRKEKLYVRLSKCSFGQTEIAFLGHMVSEAGVSVDPRKTEAIAKYPTPTNRKELLSFLGLAGYYRRFICDFAKIVRPLRDLTKGDAPWIWSKPVDEAYLHLKLSLQQAPTLKLPDFERPFIVTTDASGGCIGGVLPQKYGDDDHPITFYSKKLDRHERGWSTHEKELIAIKVATEKWRHYLHGRPFDVYTDNSACSWMLHHPRVSPKMARFLTHFSQFTFVLHHVRGKENVVADALSRPPPDGQDDEEDKEPSLPDVTYTVHECDDACVKNASQVHDHMVQSSMIRHLPTADSHLLLNDVDLRGESRQIGVAQQHVNSVDYHFCDSPLSV